MDSLTNLAKLATDANEFDTSSLSSDDFLQWVNDTASKLEEQISKFLEEGFEAASAQQEKQAEAEANAALEEASEDAVDPGIAEVQSNDDLLMAEIAADILGAKELLNGDYKSEEDLERVFANSYKLSFKGGPFTEALRLIPAEFAPQESTFSRRRKAAQQFLNIFDAEDKEGAIVTVVEFLEAFLAEGGKTKAIKLALGVE